MNKENFKNTLKAMLNIDIELYEFFDLTMFYGELKTCKFKLCHDSYRGFFFDDFEMLQHPVKTIQDFEIASSKLRHDKGTIELIERFCAGGELLNDGLSFNLAYLLAPRIMPGLILPDFSQEERLEDVDIYGCLKALNEFDEYLEKFSVIDFDDFRNDVLKISIFPNINISSLYIHKQNLTYESLKTKNPFIEQWNEH